MAMVDTWMGRPALYHLTSELIWPDVIARAKSHPHEITWRDPSDGRTALHYSCRFHYASEVVRAMLQHSQVEAAAMQDKFGSTPLHIACWNGSFDVVPLLVQANSQTAGVSDNYGRRPLHVACHSCKPPSSDVLQCLIQADPTALFARDSHGNTPLSLLCRRHESRMKLAMECVEQGVTSEETIYQTILAPFWTQVCVLMDASAGQRFASEEDWRLVHALTSIPDCPHLLFELGLKLYPDQVKEKVYGSLPLHLAAEFPTSVNNDDTLQDGYYVGTLLSLFPCAVRISDGRDRLPFHIAVESGKSWAAVSQRLFAAYPDALYRRDGKFHLPPAMIGALPARSGGDDLLVLNSLLELILADPSVVSRSTTRQ